MNGRARADGTDTYGSVILGDSGAKKMDFQDQHEDADHSWICRQS